MVLNWTVGKSKIFSFIHRQKQHFQMLSVGCGCSWSLQNFQTNFHANAVIIFCSYMHRMLCKRFSLICFLNISQLSSLEFLKVKSILRQKAELSSRNCERGRGVTENTIPKDKSQKLHPFSTYIGKRQCWEKIYSTSYCTSIGNEQSLSVIIL